MKKLIVALLAAIALMFGSALPASALSELVMPWPPIVTQTSGSCVDGEWVTQSATIVLPEVTNGRWLDDSTAGYSPTVTYTNVEPGIYKFGFITAEGDYQLVQVQDDWNRYVIKNGVAYYTVTINAVAPEHCKKDKKSRR